MKAMIFAAGLGTRLKPLTDTMPKALVPVNGVPLLDIVAGKLTKAGFDSLVINAHHFAGQIVSHVLECGGYGAGTSVSLEKDEPLETGGGILHARGYLEGCGHFLVHNVDILTNLDPIAFISQARPDALATLHVSDRMTSRYLLFDDEMRLRGWINSQTGEVRSPFGKINPSEYRKLAFSGIHYISDDIFGIMDSLGFSGKFSIIDFYLAAAAEAPIYGCMTDGFRMLDVGKTDTLSAAAEFQSRFCI